MSLPLLLSVMLLAPALDDDAPDVARLAVLPLAIEGLTLDVAAQLGEPLRRSAQAATRLSALDEAHTVELLQAAETLGVTCDRGEPQCVVELGSVLGVELVLFGSARGTKTGILLTLRLVDVAAGAEVRRVKGEVARSAGRDEQIQALVFTLMQSPEVRLGGIAIKAPAGASVVVDGEELGLAPLGGPLTGVEAGRHVVSAALPGKPARVVEVEVSPGETLRVDLEEPEGLDVMSLRTAGQTVLYAGLAGLGAGALLFVVGLIPYVVGWILYASIDLAVLSCRGTLDDCLTTKEDLQQRRELYEPLAAFQVWYFVGMGLGALVAAIGGGVSIGGATVVFLIAPPEE